MNRKQIIEWIKGRLLLDDDFRICFYDDRCVIGNINSESEYLTEKEFKNNFKNIELAFRIPSDIPRAFLLNIQSILNYYVSYDRVEELNYLEKSV